MTIILPNSVFLHIPKTGGVWVREVLAENALDIRSIKAKDMKYTTNNIGSWHNVPYDDNDFKERINRFAFVRHPLHWYRSYWSFKRSNKNWDTTQFDLQCGAQNFNRFIDNIIRYHPDGYLTQLYNFYTQHCSVIGQQERLQEDLQAIIYEYEGILIESFPEKVNVSNQDVLSMAFYTPTQVDQIMWLEREIVNKYGYG